MNEHANDFAFLLQHRREKGKKRLSQQVAVHIIYI